MNESKKGVEDQELQEAMTALLERMREDTKKVDKLNTGDDRCIAINSTGIHNYSGSIVCSSI